MTSEKKAILATHKKGGSAYHDDMFTLWYKKGKPSPTSFYNIMPASEMGFKPTRSTLKKWITESFRGRAEILDTIVQKELEIHLVREKIEMLNRHAAMGEKMQQMGADFLKDHLDDLTPTIAVRLLVEGYRIERDSKGISAPIEKVVGMSDAELLSEVEDIINASSVVIENA